MSSVIILYRDVLRTVGAVKDGPKVFQDTSDLGKAGAARAMHRLLTSISITDGMGYCQGMNYVVDFLLKLVSEERGFCLFLHALRNKHLCCLYETRLPVLSDYMEVFELYLAQRRPLLAASLKEKGFLAPFYSIEWFTTMFTLACPADLTLAIWDMFYFGVKDTQLRCALAMMEVLEPLLLPLTTEQLLKEFRSFTLHVNVADVVLRALRMQLGVVHIQPNEGNHRGGNPFVLDPKSYMTDAYGDALLALRHKYIVEAGQVMRERELGAEKWACESGGRRSSSTDDCERQHSLINDEGSKLLAQLCDKIDDDYVVLSQADVAPSRFISNTRDSDDESIEAIPPVEDVSVSSTSTPASPAPAVYRPTEAEINAFSSTTFDFFLDMELTNKTAELRELIVSANRIYLWPELNEKWSECLQYIKSDLSKYNLADYMLRYAISKKSHVRVISFFLSIGADPNSQDRLLRTPLHYAAALNRPDVARLLLLCGADVSVPGALCSLLQTPKSYSLATPIELLTNAIPHVSYSVLLWPAVLVVLRKKCCLMCNTLFSAMVAGRDKRMICPMCECAFCVTCVPNHVCVWNVDLVRARYESGLEKCGVSLKDVVDKKPPSPPPQTVCIAPEIDTSLDAAGSMSTSATPGTPEQAQLKKTISFRDQVEASPRQLRSRLRSLSMNSFGSNSSPTPPMRAQTPPPQPSPASHLPETSEINDEDTSSLSALPLKHESKRKKFSQKFKSQFKRIAKRLSIATAPESEVSGSIADVGSSQVPMYWVGYKYSDHYLSHMTPWQLYIIPLLFGAEQKYVSNTATHTSFAHNDTSHFRTSDVLADTFLEHAQTALTSILQIPPASAAAAINSSSSEPQGLYFGFEMEGYYGLIQRDYIMFSSPIVELTSDALKERNSETAAKFHRTPIKRRSLPIEMERLRGGVSTGKADARPITEVLSARSIRMIISNFLTGHWIIDETSAIWTKDECSWHCKQCFVQFSIFQRKHHCRRCGGVFCSDDAVLIDALECVPDELREVMISLSLDNSAVLCSCR